MQLRVGTMGFAYKDWVGPFYPPRTPSRDYLRLYAGAYDAVELDTTFYGIPAASTVLRWAAETPPEFRFASKLPKTITHEKRLVGADAELGRFLDAMSALGEKLGPMLVQLPPGFRADRQDDLWRLLAKLPRGLRFAVEFRHRSWLQEPVYDLLRQHNVALASLDLYYMPRQVNLTADWAYIRWLGRREDVQQLSHVVIDRQADLEWWVAAVAGLHGQVREVWGFFNNHYSGHSPATANQFRRLLGLPVVDPPPSDARKGERILRRRM